MTGRRLLGIASLAFGVLLLCLAHDVHGWQDALRSGDARLTTAPATARWDARPWLPLDPAARLLAVDGPVRERAAARAFERWRSAPQGYDNGANQARLRVQAELALTEVAGDGSDRRASRAGTLLGILLASGGAANPSEDEDAAAGVFDAAVRADPSNDAAKYDLELVLRRARAQGVREGPGNGSGTRGNAEGAGAGAPGSGY